MYRKLAASVIGIVLWSGFGAFRPIAAAQDREMRQEELTNFRFEIHRPEVEDVKTSVQMGNEATLVLRGNDSGGHRLAFRLLDVPRHGTARFDEKYSPTSAKVYYTPNPKFRGRDQFTYTASDGTHTSLPATVSVFVLGPGDDPDQYDVLPSGRRSSSRLEASDGIRADSQIDVFNATDWFVSNSLGVGTDTPLEDIELRKSTVPFMLVNGTTATNVGIELRNTNANPGNFIYTNGSGDLNFWTNGLERMFLRRSDGFVGIGTLAPYQRLTMGGTIGFKDGTTPMTMLSETCCSSGSRMIVAHSPGFADYGLYYDDPSDTFRFQYGQGTGNTSVLSVGIGNHRVGIHTGAPAADLHIAQNGNTSQEVRMSSNPALSNHFPNLSFYSNTTKVAQLISDVTTGRFVMDYNGPGGGNFSVRRAVDSGNLNDFVLFGDPNGNFGVGTTTLTPGARLTVQGNLQVNGNISKTGIGELVRIEDGENEIEYSVSIGPEVGTYVRGTAQLYNGEAVIDLPEHFAVTTSDHGLTVQLTLMDECNGLRVAEKSTRRLIVRELAQGGSNAKFDYLIQGVRKGEENRRIVHPRRAAPDAPALATP